MDSYLKYYEIRYSDGKYRNQYLTKDMVQRLRDDGCTVTCLRNPTADLIY